MEVFLNIMSELKWVCDINSTKTEKRFTSYLKIPDSLSSKKLESKHTKEKVFTGTSKICITKIINNGEERYTFRLRGRT